MQFIDTTIVNYGRNDVYALHVLRFNVRYAFVATFHDDRDSFTVMDMSHVVSQFVR
jgi:hypothetical protein